MLAEDRMRSAFKLLMMVSALGASAACQKKAPQAQDQNIDIGGPMANDPMANADIETLPPDESSGTSSTELENGADNPDVNEDVNASGNSY
jgi:hypothetical protein